MTPATIPTAVVAAPRAVAIAANVAAANPYTALAVGVAVTGLAAWKLGAEAAPYTATMLRRVRGWIHAITAEPSALDIVSLNPAE
jgi:hypothetical protein